MGQRTRVSVIPDNGLKCSLEADLHVQWVGTLEVDVDDEVPDDKIGGQGQGVFVDGMGSITLWRKNKTTYVYMNVCRYVLNSDLSDSRVGVLSHVATLPQ
jgi:hypothetical protein